MKTLVLRIIPVLVVAAACGEAPTVTAPPEASFNTAATLNITVTCVDTYNLYSMQRFDCTATASGGSGTGYSFLWQGDGAEYYDQGGISKAYYPCQYVPNSYGFGYLSATAVVLDSNGNYKGATYNKQPCDPR